MRGPDVEPPVIFRGSSGLFHRDGGRRNPGASGSVNRLLRPDSVRHMSVTTAMQGLTAAHHETQRDSSKTAREPGYAQATGRFRRWWQVLGSNQRRLSRRFYRYLVYSLLSCDNMSATGLSPRILRQVHAGVRAPGRYSEVASNWQYDDRPKIRCRAAPVGAPGCDAPPHMPTDRAAFRIAVAGRCRSDVRWPRRRPGDAGRRCGRSPGSRLGGRCAARRARA